MSIFWAKTWISQTTTKTPRRRRRRRKHRNAVTSS